MTLASGLQATPLSILFGEPNAIPENVRLQIVLDVLEALAKRKFPLARRGAAGLHLEAVTLGDDGTARVNTGSAVNGLPELVWEILAATALDGEPRSLHEVVDDLPTDVSELVAKVLGDDHDLGSAVDLLDAMQAASDGRAASRDEVKETLAALRPTAPASVGTAEAPKPAPAPPPKPEPTPADAKPPEPKPVEARSQEAKPVEPPKSVPPPKPAEQPKPIEAKPVEAPKPIEAKPVEAPKPLEVPKPPPKPVEIPKPPPPKPAEPPKSVDLRRPPPPKPPEPPKAVEAKPLPQAATRASARVIEVPPVAIATAKPKSNIFEEDWDTLETPAPPQKEKETDNEGDSGTAPPKEEPSPTPAIAGFPREVASMRQTLAFGSPRPPVPRAPFDSKPGPRSQTMPYPQGLGLADASAAEPTPPPPSGPVVAPSPEPSAVESVRDTGRRRSRISSTTDRGLGEAEAEARTPLAEPAPTLEPLQAAPEALAKERDTPPIAPNEPEAPAAAAPPQLAATSVASAPLEEATAPPAKRTSSPKLSWPTENDDDVPKPGPVIQFGPRPSPASQAAPPAPPVAKAQPAPGVFTIKGTQIIQRQQVTPPPKPVKTAAAFEQTLQAGEVATPEPAKAAIQVAAQGPSSVEESISRKRPTRVVGKRQYGLGIILATTVALVLIFVIAMVASR